MITGPELWDDELELGVLGAGVGVGVGAGAGVTCGAAVTAGAGVTAAGCTGALAVEPLCVGFAAGLAFLTA